MSWIQIIGGGAITIISVFALGRVVTRPHGVSTTLAWILAIIAFPIIGSVLYLLIAEPRIPRMTRRMRLSKNRVREALVSSTAEHPLPIEVPSEPGEQSIFHLATQLTEVVPCTGNQVELLTENAHAFETIEEALARAKRSIWVEYYIIKNDETGHRFLDLLSLRAAEGIQVRLLFDGVGSRRLDAPRLAKIRAAGGRAEAFLPVNPLRRRWALHLRNHRKLIIVDGEVGLTGGMNVGNEYSGRLLRRRADRWRDAHLLLRGPSVYDLAHTFVEDWNFATDEELILSERPKPVEGATSLVSVIPSGPDQDYNAHGRVYFAGITSAKHQCLITSPYFIPDEPTLYALQTAALRGVDVRLLVPRFSDLPLVTWAARSYYASLVHAGVRIFEYLPSMLHAKTMVVDGRWALVGSANMDIRSFGLNFELGALVVDSSFATQLEQRYYLDLQESEEMTQQGLARRRLPRQLGENLARLLSPLL